MNRSIYKFIPTLVLILLAGCKISQPNQDSVLYTGVEFEMPLVQEPVIPRNSVSITDFGAISGGGVLNSKAFVDAIDAVSEKGGGKVIIPA